MKKLLHLSHKKRYIQSNAAAKGMMTDLKDDLKNNLKKITSALVN